MHILPIQEFPRFKRFTDPQLKIVFSTSSLSESPKQLLSHFQFSLHCSLSLLPQSLWSWTLFPFLLSFFRYPFNWHLSFRGYGCRWTLGLNPGNQVMPPSLSLQHRLSPLSSHKELPNNATFESSVLLTHQDHVCNWTQLKPLYTLLWFRRVCAETASCHHPRQAWYVSSLLIKFVTYQSSVAASLGPLHTGISF